MNKAFKITKKNNILIIKNLSNKTINDLSVSKVNNLFREYGIILFKNFKTNPINLKKFTSKFTLNYANDAGRRDTLFESKYIKSVDKGNKAMPLHSEASYSSSWPEIIWFYCVQPSKSSGYTTVCDGIKVYENLKLTTKKFFLENQIEYNVQIALNQTFTPNKNVKKREWFFDEIGCINPILDLKKNLIKFTQKRYAIYKSSRLNKYSFVNHLQIYLKRDPQLKYWKINNKKYLPKNIKDDVVKCCKQNTIDIKWKKNEFCMIDNKRYMHGRTQIKGDDRVNRKIINIQTLTSKIKN